MHAPRTDADRIPVSEDERRRMAKPSPPSEPDPEHVAEWVSMGEILGRDFLVRASYDREDWLSNREGEPLTGDALIKRIVWTDEHAAIVEALRNLARAVAS